MTPHPPLPYAAWDCVLQYLSVDTRLALSLRCPAIRNLDQRVPLKIGDLRVSEFFIEIDMLKGMQSFVRNREPDNSNGYVLSERIYSQYIFEVIKVSPV